MYGGNPEREFIGDPKDKYSYGVYEKPISEVANKFKKGIKNISGTSFNNVLKLIKKGYPIQVWSSIDCQKPKYANYTWIDHQTGKKIKWKQPFHSVVVIGYSKEKVVVADPHSGSTREYDIKDFRKAYNFFGKRALYYE